MRKPRTLDALLGRVPDTPSLAKEQGVWVLHTGQPLPGCATDEVLQQVRDERDLANLGKKK